VTPLPPIAASVAHEAGVARVEALLLQRLLNKPDGHFENARKFKQTKVNIFSSYHLKGRHS
jgi:hypothetical protein